jgi:hypothetical protein
MLAPWVVFLSEQSVYNCKPKFAIEVVYCIQSFGKEQNIGQGVAQRKI